MKRAVLIAACLLLLVPAQAGAAKKKPKSNLGPVSTISAVGPVAPGAGAVSTATATCPAGTKAIGGGYRAPFNSGVRIVVTESFRSGGRSWTAVGVSVSGSAATTVEAYCRKTTKAVADVVSAVTLPAVSAATAATAATCPPGSKLVSGGFQGSRTAGTALAFPLTSLSAPAGVWSVLGINTSASSAQTMVAHAYCVRGIRQPKVLSAVATSVLASGGSPGSATSPKCPKPKKPKKGKKKPPRRLSGGGFSVPPPPATPIPLVTDSLISGGAWLTVAANVSGPAGPVPVTSQAICA